MLEQECEDECECTKIILDNKKRGECLFFVYWIRIIKSDLPYPP